MQALYFCKPFRHAILEYHESLPKDHDESLLTALGDLFASISNQKKRTGVLAPKKFIERLKKDNVIFNSYMHQDAHEFFNFVVNECCEVLVKQHRREHPTPDGEETKPVKTWIHDIFEGGLTNQTQCLWCENVTSRHEAFVDLSLDIEQNTSVSACLKQFSSNELLASQDKFQCDACGGLQEAHKRMLVKSSPKVLALHLKRFKYLESLGRHAKLMHRVVFPSELKIPNMTEDADGQDAAYQLFAVVVHVGSGPNHGHYVCLVKSHGQWLTYDDDTGFIDAVTNSLASAEDDSSDLVAAIQSASSTTAFDAVPSTSAVSSTSLVVLTRPPTSAPTPEPTAGWEAKYAARVDAREIMHYAATFGTTLLVTVFTVFVYFTHPAKEKIGAGDCAVVIFAW